MKSGILLPYSRYSYKGGERTMAMCRYRTTFWRASITSETELDAGVSTCEAFSIPSTVSRALPWQGTTPGRRRGDEIRQERSAVSRNAEYVRRITGRYSAISDGRYIHTARSIGYRSTDFIQRDTRPLNVYEPAVMAIRTGDGKIMLMNQ